MSTALGAALPRRHLLRILGLAFGIAVVVGDTVGVGILRTPGATAARLQHPALIYGVWLALGLYTLMAVNTLAELATAIPKAGGPYVYVRRSFGDFLGFACGWGDFGLQTIAIGYLAVACSEFLAQALPRLSGYEHLLAPALIIAFAALNSLGLKTSSVAAQLVSLLKVLLLAALVIAAFALAVPVDASAPAALPPPAAPAVGAVAIIVSMQIVMEVYDGWNAACYFTEETTDPGHTLPRALIYGVLLIMLVYLAVNAALLHVLSPAELASSKLAAGDALARLLGPASRTAVALLATCAALGVLNTVMLVAPRILYGMSRDALFVPLGGYVTRRGVPLAGLWLSVVAAMAFAAAGSFETLYAAGAFLAACTDLLCSASLFVLRRREPQLPRPYRAFGYPWIPGLVLAAAAALLLAFVLGNPLPSLIAIAVLAVTYPLYRLGRRGARA
jgi:basic amino acid/polyamine antiporter, APA family